CCDVKTRREQTTAGARVSSGQNWGGKADPHHGSIERSPYAHFMPWGPEVVPADRRISTSFSGYHRQPFLSSPHARRTFEALGITIFQPARHWLSSRAKTRFC